MLSPLVSDNSVFHIHRYFQFLSSSCSRILFLLLFFYLVNVLFCVLRKTWIMKRTAHDEISSLQVSGSSLVFAFLVVSLILFFFWGCNGWTLWIQVEPAVGAALLACNFLLKELEANNHSWESLPPNDWLYSWN